MTTSMRFLVAGSVCALLSLCCLLLFEFLGSSVDAQGVLHEPFALVPLSWMLLVVALYCALRYWRARRS
jgi:hypothetical protein